MPACTRSGRWPASKSTFTHDVSTLARALNAQLPEDVRVLAVEEAGAGLSRPLRRAVEDLSLPDPQSTRVASPFERAFVWHVPQPLDVEAMQQAAARLLGRHDFAAFRSVGTEVPDSMRTLTRLDRRPGAGAMASGSVTARPLLTYEVSGDGFLRHMVRAIVGRWSRWAAGGAIRPEWKRCCAARDRHAAGATAPPHGLFLVRVEYD